MILKMRTWLKSTSSLRWKTKKMRKEEDGTVVLPSGVTITWEPEGMSVEVGEPYPP